MKYKELYVAPLAELVVLHLERNVVLSFNNTEQTETIGRDGEDDL